MNKVFKLPIEIIDYIVELTDSHEVAYALRGIVSNYVINKFEKNTLVYGQVQGGKTKAIIELLRTTPGLKVLVIQNSLLVLKQYKQRLASENLIAQVIDNKTKNITSDIVIVLANCYRYNYFSSLVKNGTYTLIMDEGDAVCHRCPLQGKRTYYVTATPDSLMSNFDIQRTIVIPKDPNYYGLSELQLEVADDEFIAVDQFLSGPPGMMLVNSMYTVAEMEYFSRELSVRVQVPVVLLTSDKTLFTNGMSKSLNYIKSISGVIDSLSEHKHIVFVANKLSNRGLSYTSSDYSRHLTAQYTKVNRFTQFYQSLRILGIYRDNPTLTLYLNSQSQLNKVKRYKRRNEQKLNKLQANV